MDYLQFKEQLNKQRSLQHHGIKGQRWGIRRFQNEDGSLTPEGEKRYGVSDSDKDLKKEDLYKKTSELEAAYDEASDKAYALQRQVYDKWNKSDARKKMIEQEAKEFHEKYPEYDTLEEQIKATTDWWDYDDGDPISQGFYDDISKALKDPEWDKMLNEWQEAESIADKALESYITSKNNLDKIKLSEAKKKDTKKAIGFISSLAGISAVIVGGALLTLKR